MSSRVRRRVRRYLKASASLILLVLIAAACSSDGFPTDYGVQFVEQDDGTEIDLVELNWLEGCEVGLADSDLAEAANKVCACSYATISGANGIAFEDFVALDSDLKSDPSGLVERRNDGTLTPTETRLSDIVKECIARG